MAGNKKNTLEENLRQLEKLVGEIETPGLAIDESIEKYATAMELALDCRERLNAMSLRVAEVRKRVAEADEAEKKQLEAQEKTNVDETVL